MTNKGQARK